MLVKLSGRAWLKSLVSLDRRVMWVIIHSTAVDHCWQNEIHLYSLYQKTWDRGEKKSLLATWLTSSYNTVQQMSSKNRAFSAYLQWLYNHLKWPIRWQKCIWQKYQSKYSLFSRYIFSALVHNLNKLSKTFKNSTPDELVLLTSTYTSEIDI